MLSSTKFNENPNGIFLAKMWLFYQLLMLLCSFFPNCKIIKEENKISYDSVQFLVNFFRMSEIWLSNAEKYVRRISSVAAKECFWYKLFFYFEYL